MQRFNSIESEVTYNTYLGDNPIGQKTQKLFKLENWTRGILLSGIQDRSVRLVFIK